jgi:hypothetical protein
MDVTILDLLLPILLSAVLVWIASAIVWTVMPHRKTEFAKLPDEEAARAALRGAPVGEYSIPNHQGRMNDPEYLRKYQEGPVGIIRILPSGRPAMAKPMVLGFIFYVVVGITVAYVASRHLPSGAEYLAVHRLVGTVAWAAYFFGQVQDSIWFGKPWASTWKLLIEALVYGSLTGGTFGWLWPAA